MTQPTCHTCVFAFWDKGLWLRSLGLGMPVRPVCANHPDSPGRDRETPCGQVCRNYRVRPATPDLSDGSVQRIPVTGGFIAYVDAADYEWLSQWTWGMHGGYVARIENGKRIYMHRQIMNPPKGKVVDHISGNRMDNIRANLHVCSPAENNRNQTKRRGSSSQYLGLYFNRERRKWHARIGVNGKQESIGYFDNELDAARAYDAKAVEVYGEFARLNFPDDRPPVVARASCPCPAKPPRRQPIHAVGAGPRACPLHAVMQDGEGKRVRTKEGKKVTHAGERRSRGAKAEGRSRKGRRT
jgi:hypothetical protein